MCGITCIVSLPGRQPRPRIINTIRLTQSLDRIKHRGPDESGQWISPSGHIALGHVRLRINDLSSTGAQPLHHNDGQVHAVVNGEIYDYEKIRESCACEDYQFQGTSDCELVLALYSRYGLGFVEHLRGEFSLCLYDDEKQLFIAVRDRYGIKPLFWTVQNGELWVSAEIKGFLGLGWQAEWDVESIVNGDFQIGAQTIFKDVRKVKPGHMLLVQDGVICEEQRYWDSTYPNKDGEDIRSVDEMIEGVRERLLSAVQQRLRADVKVGVSLSGGLDSSIVAGMVNHLLSEGAQAGSCHTSELLSCFGIAFDEDSGFDESGTANRTAEFLGVDFHKKHMGEAELAEMFEDATWHDEQPNPDLNFIGTYALSELFREKGFTVNINGQGSDEIFGGYNIFLTDFLCEPDLTFSANDHVDEKEQMEFLQESEEQMQTLYTGQLDLFQTHTQLGHTFTPQMMASAFPPLPIKSAFAPKTPTSFQDTYASHLSSDLADKSWHPLHTAQYIFVRAHLQNLLLSNLGDRSEMAHSVEGRTPFLDHHLTEYVNSLPPSMKIRYDAQRKQWIEKWILREAGKPFVTEEIYRMKKHPYSAPVRYEVEGPLWKTLSRLVTRDSIERLGWLEWVGCEELLEKAFKGEDSHVMSFRLVLCLAQWVVLQRTFRVKKAEVE